MKNSYRFLRTLKLTLSGAASLVFLMMPLRAGGYYPPRVSLIEGQGSYEPAGDVDWSEVTVNMPLLSGDRILSLADSRIEVELGEGNFVRIGEDTDVVFGQVSGKNGDFQLQKGELVLRVNDGGRYLIQLPSATVTIRKRGSYRLSVDELGQGRVIVWSGKAQVENSIAERSLKDGEMLLIESMDAPLQTVLYAGGRDNLDLWSDRRDAVFASSRSVAQVGGSYYSAYDLDRYGTWDNVAGYGQVWFPSVSFGWVPYRVGRWCHYPSWGWTWVSSEPWGWLPYHHGRWYYDTSFARWGWVPGYFSYWSPALVNFYWGSGYVGWSPFGYGFGFGGNRGYYGGSVTVVNNHTVVNNYYNSHGPGLTVVPEGSFRAPRVDRVRVPEVSGQMARSMRQGLPVELVSQSRTSRTRTVAGGTATPVSGSGFVGGGRINSGSSLTSSPKLRSGQSSPAAGAPRQVTATTPSASRSKASTASRPSGFSRLSEDVADRIGSTPGGGRRPSYSGDGPGITTIPKSRMETLGSGSQSQPKSTSSPRPSRPTASPSGDGGSYRSPGRPAYTAPSRPSVSRSRAPSSSPPGGYIGRSPSSRSGVPSTGSSIGSRPTAPPPSTGSPSYSPGGSRSRSSGSAPRSSRRN